MNDPLDVIAAALALPIINDEIKYLESQRPMGNTRAADEAHREITKQMRPLIDRRISMRRIVLGPDWLGPRFGR